MSIGKGPHDYLDLGDWNAVCAECGRKRKARELVRNWQGLYKCPDHNEPRHPQDYVRAVPDIQTPPWVQPPTDAFVAVCFPNDTCGIAWWGVAGCMIADYVSPFFNPTVDPTDPVIGQQQIFLTNGMLWFVPLDWDRLSNTIECVGKGGDGGRPAGGGTGTNGGGGGAYSRSSNIALPPGQFIRFSVDDDTGTWIGGTSYGTALVSAQNGSGSKTSPAHPIAGIGGAAVNGLGDIKYSGGNGGSLLFATNSSGGGGGAAGPSGNGAKGGDVTTAGVGGGGGGSNGGGPGLSDGTPGDNGGYGTSGPVSHDGYSDNCFDSTHGTGGGGGGNFSGIAQTTGIGGPFGGGAGGGSVLKGGAGLIVITYTPR